MSHLPVMLDETLSALSPKDGGVYVDATFGGGGHTRAILAAANCRVIGLDRDPDAVARGKVLEQESNRFLCHQSKLSDLQKTLSGLGVDGVDGILFDLGVSSYQLDTPERGFSFMKNAPLDMRMEKEGMTAMDFVNHATEDEISRVIYTYGEEKKARKIARTLCQERPVETTEKLAEIVKKSVRVQRGKNKKNVHPATRTFQAIRMVVNDELREIEQGLNHAKTMLRPGGKLVVISFHSLEDRMVKEFLRDEAGGKGGSRHMPETINQAVSFTVLRPSKVLPTDGEIQKNPRSRSARMRVGVRVAPSVSEKVGDEKNQKTYHQPSGLLFFVSTPYFLNHFMKGFLS